MDGTEKGDAELTELLAERRRQQRRRVDPATVKRIAKAISEAAEAYRKATGKGGDQ